LLFMGGDDNRMVPSPAACGLQISSYLLQAARDEEAAAALGGGQHRERGVTTTGAAEPYLQLLLPSPNLSPGGRGIRRGQEERWDTVGSWGR
jgi:hypothetical protein